MTRTQPSSINVVTRSNPRWPDLPQITPEDISLLSRCFSTKSIFDVDLGCDEEAKQVLQASLHDPAIQHAVYSLKALRSDYETAGDASVPARQQTSRSSHDYGLQQYCKAMGGLAANLSSPTSQALRSALLCCQIFISIEQVRGNYVTMAQHISQGLAIMHQYRARPSLDASGNLVPACSGQMPLLDVLIIKIFAVPCKFSERLAPANTGEAAIALYPEQTIETRRTRKIAPDMRAELNRISSSLLEFLDQVANISSTEDAGQLLPVKASLVDSLHRWSIDLKHDQPPHHTQLSLSFMQLFHQVMKVVLVGALDSSPDVYALLGNENHVLQHMATLVTLGVQKYNKPPLMMSPPVRLQP